VLIRSTLSMYRGANYLEMDINIHNFGSVARSGLQMIDFHKMAMNWGFCIESRDDDEMPEVLFGCAKLTRPCYELTQDFDA
jgi:hypothetical protein